ncbi:hypothetical protein ACO0LO_09855 [Undibacterium sp. TJN25]|uniref:hypothetical protein n=1 Tax=Undibacterium sp. TJN25 TaxID=3413056 RepID=UPI003BF23206
MKNLNLAKLLLQSYLLGKRFGLDTVLLILFMPIALVEWSYVLPTLQAQVAAQKTAIIKWQSEKKKETAPVIQQSSAARHLYDFYRVLGQDGYQEQQLKTIFSIAKKNGIALSQSEYKSSYDKSGNFHTLRIILPVKASYAVVRKFCEELLEAIPFAALNEINFKRDTIANPTLETRLSFTLYLSDGHKSVDASAKNNEL